MKVSDKEFLENEDITLMQATEDLLYYGLPITTDTVRLHHEFVPTSCPHRSLALHGGTTESVKNYFVIRMNELAQLGSTVEEMLETISQPKVATEAVDEKLQETVPSSDEENTELNNNNSTTTNESLAKEVILGLWGNGAERKRRLEEAGYDYDAIQEIVNKTLNE